MTRPTSASASNTTQVKIGNVIVNRRKQNQQSIKLNTETTVQVNQLVTVQRFHVVKVYDPTNPKVKGVIITGSFLPKFLPSEWVNFTKPELGKLKSEGNYNFYSLEEYTKRNPKWVGKFYMAALPKYQMLQRIINHPDEDGKTAQFLQVMDVNVGTGHMVTVPINFSINQIAEKFWETIPQELIPNGEPKYRFEETHFQYP